MPVTVIESFGSTSLTQVGNDYYLYNSVGSGPALKVSGVNFVAGQLGNWTPIGAEQTATGYDVAWKVTGVDKYTVWFTDSNGNFISNAGSLTGASSTLQSFESVFHQDLNGDGFIGVVSGTTTVIELFGSTSLTQVGNDYYLYNSASSGPALKVGNVDVVAGQFGSWTPIGAEQTATGYDVAWKVTGTDQYTVWFTDSNGNFISNTGSLTGASSTLQSFEICVPPGSKWRRVHRPRAGDGDRVVWLD